MSKCLPGFQWVCIDALGLSRRNMINLRGHSRSSHNKPTSGTYPSSSPSYSRHWYFYSTKESPQSASDVRVTAACIPSSEHEAEIHGWLKSLLGSQCARRIYARLPIAYTLDQFGQPTALYTNPTLTPLWSYKGLLGKSRDS